MFTFRWAAIVQLQVVVQCFSFQWPAKVQLPVGGLSLASGGWPLFSSGSRPMFSSRLAAEVQLPVAGQGSASGTTKSHAEVKHENVLVMSQFTLFA
jgi:hypothetical protein